MCRLLEQNIVRRHRRKDRSKRERVKVVKSYAEPKGLRDRNFGYERSPKIVGGSQIFMLLLDLETVFPLYEFKMFLQNHFFPRRKVRETLSWARESARNAAEKPSRHARNYMYALV